MVNEQCYDVIVIGGGPAGTTVASLLVDKGYQVALFEKDQHPRFHIGESLLPMSIPLLKRLGVFEKVQKIGKKKLGATFFSHIFPHSCTYEFKDALIQGNDSAFQVQRADFDQILFSACQEKGVTVFQNATVKECVVDSNNLTQVAVEQSDEVYQYCAKFIVDASGRDTFFSNKNKVKQANPQHRSAAIYAHFEHAKNFPPLEQGNIGIYWFKYGWMWLIPFLNSSVSVGVVCKPEYLKQRQADLKQFFVDTIAANQHLKQHLGDAKMITEPQATGNYAYCSKNIYGNNCLLVGDAYSFVDPVFSSGVHIALRSAFEAADMVDKLFKKPHKKFIYLQQYKKFVDNGIAEFCWVIYRIMTPEFHYLFMHPRNILNVKAAIISLLSGDVFDKTPIKLKLFFFKLIYFMTKYVNFDGKDKMTT